MKCTEQIERRAKMKWEFTFTDLCNLIIALLALILPLLRDRFRLKRTVKLFDVKDARATYRFFDLELVNVGSQVCRIERAWLECSAPARPVLPKSYIVLPEGQ